MHLRKGEQRAPGLSRAQPAGLVPALRLDDGRCSPSRWRSSNTSTRRIRSRRSCRRRRPSARAFVRSRWRSAATSTRSTTCACCNYLIGTLGLDEDAEGRLVPPLGRRRASGAREAAVAATAATGRFCHGDAPTLADVCLVPQLANARRFDIDMVDRYPTLMRIECRLLGRLPAFAAPPRAPARRRIERLRQLSHFHWSCHEIRHSRLGYAVGAGRRQRASAFPSATSIASAATTPSTRRRWAATRPRSRRSFSPSPPMRSCRWCRPPSGGSPIRWRPRTSTTRSSSWWRSARRGVKVAPERAQALIYGYAVGLDMTRRDLQSRDARKEAAVGHRQVVRAGRADRHRSTRRPRSAIRCDGAHQRSTSTAAAGSRAILPT